MTTETHTPGTPLPWAHSKFGDIIAANETDSDGDAIVVGWTDRSVIRSSYTVGNKRDRESNARFIVHACNLYPELLEALDLASTVLSNAAENGYYIGEGVFEKVNAVLAKARGGAS